MKITITINGHQVEAEVDEKEMKEAMGEKKEKRTGYEEAEEDGDFYYVEWYGCVENGPDGHGEYEKSCYKSANYYTDAKVAENNARADALMRELRRFAAEHGGCTSGKRGGNGGSAHIILGHGDKPVATDVLKNQAGAIDFCSKEAAEEAIDVFYDDLRWYFTVYDPMPEGWWGND